MDKVTKVLDCEVKALGERTYEFTASTSDVDRDGEVIEATGWDLKNFKKNPVIMYGHDYRSLPIGKATRIWIRDGALKNTVQFTDEGDYGFADIVERLVQKGFLKTESVGFIPKEWRDGDGDKAPKRTFEKQELLEISIVPVPSNPNALADAVEAQIITTKELEILTKPEETDDFIHIPVRECKITATIDISKKEGIKAKYCGKVKKVGTYMFNKKDPYNWTMAKAKKWVKEHDDGKSLDACDTDNWAIDTSGPIITDDNTSDNLVVDPKPKEISQDEIGDELDYVKSLIVNGMNEEVTEQAWELVREILRLTGDEIPDDIEETVGIVLNEKNYQRLGDIIQLIEGMIYSAKEPSEEPEGDKREFSFADHKDEIRELLKEVVEEAQGKVK